MKTLTTVLITFAVCLMALSLLNGCDSEGDDADTDATDDLDPALNCEGGRLDPNTSLCWQDPPDEKFDQASSLGYCGALILAGHDDWYLPSRDDFTTLLGGCDQDVQDGLDGYCNSCQESVACNAAFGEDEEWYWTSSSEEEQCDYVWMVNLEIGELGLHDPGDLVLQNVRCVRNAY